VLGCSVPRGGDGAGSETLEAQRLQDVWIALRFEVRGPWFAVGEGKGGNWMLKECKVVERGEDEFIPYLK
jgi:hypothetical protein